MYSYKVKKYVLKSFLGHLYDYKFLYAVLKVKCDLLCFMRIRSIHEACLTKLNVQERIVSN